MIKDFQCNYRCSFQHPVFKFGLSGMNVLQNQFHPVKKNCFSYYNILCELTLKCVFGRNKLTSNSSILSRWLVWFWQLCSSPQQVTEMFNLFWGVMDWIFLFNVRPKQLPFFEIRCFVTLIHDIKHKANCIVA